MDNYLIEKTYWIWLVIFSIIIIPLQDLSKALFCIPSIIKDYKYSHVLSLTSYNHGYVNYVFMHSILDVSGAIIITIILAILGLIIYLVSKRFSFKCFGLALSLSMILSRLLLYIYIFFYRNYQINDEGLISEKLNINSLVIYTALILLFAFLLYILFKSLNMPTKDKIIFIIFSIMIFAFCYENVYLIKNYIFNHDVVDNFILINIFH